MQNNKQFCQEYQAYGICQEFARVTLKTPSLDSQVFQGDFWEDKGPYKHHICRCSLKDFAFLKLNFANFKKGMKIVSHLTFSPKLDKLNV